MGRRGHGQDRGMRSEDYVKEEAKEAGDSIRINENSIGRGLVHTNRIAVVKIRKVRWRHIGRAGLAGKTAPRSVGSVTRSSLAELPRQRGLAHAHRVVDSAPPGLRSRPLFRTRTAAVSVARAGGPKGP